MKFVKSLFFVFLLFLATLTFSQHDFLKINLEFSQALEKNNS
jgi:hypothetical protein